ncbi:FKBP-type peptidyl-prolyl cis-trans isomerase [Campylobacter sp. RM13119]|uniref:FKBP-type peptidyl-prolyl cis-trans isomerase n=1 Tax=Campylobacter californiensis TaxID=1032243 RepID=UPI001476178B|nr:FKBP-type peptidyl-prolyl cis-trans isomerase [Campylobacter sp. RM13119]MBE3605425.1 FKBP-type peptidyl-prolyl cis-trans isomerase [Campylobacter sp. RM13119]
MQKVILKSLIPIFCLSSCVFGAQLSTTEEKESYAIGASTGSYISNQLHNQMQMGVKSDVNIVIEGLIDALKKQTKMKDEDIISLLNERADRLNKITEENKKIQLANNKKIGKEFMARNAKNKNVKTTKSGLQYEMLVLGGGDKPKPESIVEVHYKGYLPNGEVFENTYDNKTSMHLSLINVIEGFKEGLLLMNAGSKYKFVIPSELAYADEELETIPAGSTVVFEVELLKVLKPGEYSKIVKDMSEQEIKNIHQTK